MTGLAPIVAIAQTQSPAPNERAAIRARIEPLFTKEGALLDGLDKLDRQIDRLVGEVERAHIELSDLRPELERLDRRAVELAERVERQQAHVRRRLRARYRTERTGYLRVLLGAGDPTELVRRRYYLVRILETDLDRLAELRRTYGELELARTERHDQARRFQEIEAMARRQRRALESERKVRNVALRRVRARQDLLKQALGARARARDALLAKLDEAGDDLHPASEAQKMAAERGRLPWPARGPVLEGFGRQKDPELGTETFVKGVQIGAVLGAPVRAVYSGTLVYSGWYKGFGNLVMINHGDRYYSLYAHLGRITCALTGAAEPSGGCKGKRVSQGEVIGTVGDTGSLRGPLLYFELRWGGRALRPSVWLQPAR